MALIASYRHHHSQLCCVPTVPQRANHVTEIGCSSFHFLPPCNIKYAIFTFQPSLIYHSLPTGGKKYTHIMCRHSQREL